MDKLRLKEVRELVNKLSFLYSCDLEFLKEYNFYKNKANKVYISKINVEEDLDLKRFHLLGIYFGTFHDKNRFRLSIEGSKFVKPTRNYVTLKKDYLSSYLSAENLFKEEVEFFNWEDNCPFLIVQFEGENLGCISVKGDQLLTYMPKSRKLDYNKVF